MAIMGFAPGLRAEGSDIERWYFVPQAGGIYTDDERGVESSDVLAGIAIGRQLGERWALGLMPRTVAALSTAHSPGSPMPGVHCA